MLQAVTTKAVARPVPLPSPTTGILTAIFLAGIAPVLIVLLTPSNGHPAWVGAMVVMLLAGIRYAWVVASAQRRLFEMVIWLFVYVFLGAAPLVQLREKVDPSTTPNINHDFDWVSVAIVIIGCVAFIFGSFAAKHRPPTGWKAQAPRRVSQRRTALLGWAMIAFAVFYISRIGLDALLGSRATRFGAVAAAWPDTTTGAIISAVISMGLLVSVIAQLEVRRNRKAAGEKLPFVMLVVSIALLFVCINPFSIPRFVFGTVALSFLAAIGLYGTLNRFRTTALAALFGFVFLFPLADTFRRSLDTKLEFENPLASLLSGDFDSFSQITNTALYVARNGITWGDQALGVILFWVPRSIWSEKALDTGVLLGESRGYGFTNLSAPLWAELFINGGWALLIVGMFAFGFAVRRWDAATEIRLAATGIPPILACIVPFYLLIMLRGSLLQSMAYLAVILLCAWFVSRPNGDGATPESGTISTKSLPSLR